MEIIIGTVHEVKEWLIATFVKEMFPYWCSHLICFIIAHVLVIKPPPAISLEVLILYWKDSDWNVSHFSILGSRHLNLSLQCIVFLNVLIHWPYWLKNIFGDHNGFQFPVVFEHVVQCEKCSFADIFDLQSTSRSNHDLLLGWCPALTSLFTYGSDNGDWVAISKVVPIFWLGLGSWIVRHHHFTDARFMLYAEGAAGFELTIC